MKVVWTQRARGHLPAIHDYIAADSPRNALRMADRITRKTESLARFPKSGHLLPEYECDDSVGEIRQILEGSYRVIHRVIEDRVEVLAVIHGARQLPPASDFN